MFPRSRERHLGIGSRGVRSSLIIQPGLESAIERLAAIPLIINGVAPNPVAQFIGADALASSWTGRDQYANAMQILGGGSNPIIGNVDAFDLSSYPKFQDGQNSFQATDARVGDIGLHDFTIEIVGWCGANTTFRGVFDKVNAVGHMLYTNSSGTLLGFRLYTSIGASPDKITTIEAFTWFHYFLCIDRDENSVNGGIAHLNAIPDAGANYYTWRNEDISSAASFLKIGSRTAGPAGAMNGGIAYAAVHAHLNWFAGGATNAAQWLEVARQRKALLFGTKPLRSSSGLLYPSSVGSTVGSCQIKVSGGVQTLSAITASAQRTERGVDVDGVPYTAAIVEGAVRNLCTRSYALGGWNAIGSPVRVDNVADDPMGFVRAGELTVTAVDSIYRTTSGLAAGNPTAEGFWIKRISTSGVLKISNPFGDAVGHWTVDLAALPDRWVKIDRNSPYITVLAEFVVHSSGATGMKIWSTGATITVNIWGMQYENNLTYLTGEDVVTVTSEVVKPADVGLIFLITEGVEIGAGKGALVVKYIAHVHTPPAGEYLAIVDDGTTDNRIGIYCHPNKKLYGLSRALGGVAGDAVGAGANACDFRVREVLLNWKANHLQICTDGVWSAPDVALDIPTGLTTLRVGCTSVPANHANKVRIIDVRTAKAPLSWGGRWR